MGQTAHDLTWDIDHRRSRPRRFGAQTNLRVEEVVEQLRHEVFDAGAELQPLPTIEEMHARLARVAAELRQLAEDITLVAHVAELNQSGFIERVEQVEKDIANGWEPPSSPVEDVLARLRAARPTA